MTIEAIKISLKSIMFPSLSSLAAISPAFLVISSDRFKMFNTR